MLIRNYGLFWRAHHVYWGGANNPGELWGVSARARRSIEVRFWDQIGVYALYRNYDLVYIGQVGRGNHGLGSRLKTHTRDHLAGRWDTFSWFGLRKVNKNGTLSIVPERRSDSLTSILNFFEGVAITIGEPPLNKQGAQFKTVTKYLQIRDERLGRLAADEARHTAAEVESLAEQIALMSDQLKDLKKSLRRKNR